MASSLKVTGIAVGVVQVEVVEVGVEVDVVVVDPRGRG